MSKSQFIRVSGLALILSSLPYAMPNVSLAAWLIGSILLGIGILGLRARYAASVGPFGSRILLGGVIGMLAIYVILVVMYLGLTRGGTLGLEGTNAFNPDNLWMLVYSGPLLPLIALALFGVSELRHKPISHLNWLPLATGVWFPVLWGFLIVYQFAHHGTFPNQYWNSIVMPLLLFQFFMLCLLGSVLIFDKGQEMATA